MALDLKLPKLTSTEVASAVAKPSTVTYDHDGYDYNALTDAEKEERMLISRKLLPPHVFIPAESAHLRYKPPVEFFDLSRRWRRTPKFFSAVLAPLGKATDETLLKNIDKYPDGYDPFVHGPYIQHRFYGKIDTPFLDTKMGDMQGWLSRRVKTPMSTFSLIRRGVHKYHDRWIACKNFNGAALIHVILGLATIFYVFDWHHKAEERHAKYH